MHAKSVKLALVAFAEAFVFYSMIRFTSFLFYKPFMDCQTYNTIARTQKSGSAGGQSLLVVTVVSVEI